jgi:DNA modification methylase
MEGVEGHPTVKPLAVVKDFVSRCPVGGLVYDPFIGSGTTAIAAIDLHRRWVGSEIHAGYYSVAQKRVEDFMAQGNLF